MHCLSSHSIFKNVKKGKIGLKATHWYRFTVKPRNKHSHSSAKPGMRQLRLRANYKNSLVMQQEDLLEVQQPRESWTRERLLILISLLLCQICWPILWVAADCKFSPCIVLFLLQVDAFFPSQSQENLSSEYISLLSAAKFAI